MPDHDWNAHYASGFTPWDSDEPDPALVATVEAGTIPAGRALEVGCGTGTNALWLAARGFDVLGVDVSPLAIDRARAKLSGAANACRFDSRIARTSGSCVGPSAPPFQLRCSCVPSRLRSPVGSLCLRSWLTRSASVTPSCDVMKFPECPTGRVSV